MPRKRGVFSRIFRVFWRLSGATFLFNNSLFMSMRGIQRAAPYLMNDGPEVPPRKTDTGIPEAEISDAEQEWATLREKRQRNERPQ